MKRFNGLACGLVLATHCLAHAQVTTTETTTTPTPTTEVHRVSQILGSIVQLEGTNNFGRVEDIILDDNGAMSYLVVSNNGRNVLLPWDAGNMNYGKRVVTYSVPPQAVQPFYFERNALPNVRDQQFTTRLRQAFPNAGAVRRGDRVVEEREKVRVKPDGSVIIKSKERVKDQ